MRLFHVFSRVLTSRITVGLVLFVALALLAWYGGPKLAIDEARPLQSQANRLLAIAALAVLFLGLEVFRRWRLNRLNRRILSSLGSFDDAPEFDDRIGRVREGYAQLCESLRTSGAARRHNRRHLRMQSWYLLLGESGSGRSSALANSGLEFVFDIGHFAGAAGRVPERSGECGWWVTDDAVFVVAPGDFVNELGPTQAAEWDDLLGCLKSGRRHRPLNAVIVAIPANVLQLEPTGLEIAAQIRRRLQEAVLRFDTVLPVYLLITKCDGIAGFTEYFTSLRPEERECPLGVMVPLPSSRSVFAGGRDGAATGTLPGAAALAEFGNRYRKFVADLTAWTNTRLETERDPDHRRLAFGFPQQMQALGGSLETVVQRIFGPSRFRRNALFRGVFFASARQRGPVADMVMQIHRQTWNLIAPEPTSHVPERAASYFLKGVLKDILLAERGLARREPAARRRVVVAGGAAFVLAATAAVALGASLWLGSVDAQRQVAAISRAIDSHEISRVAVPENDFAQAALAVATLRSRPQPPGAGEGRTAGDTARDPAGAVAWATELPRTAQRLGTSAGRIMLRIPTGLSERLDDAYTAAAHSLVRPAVVRELGDEVARLAGAGNGSGSGEPPPDGLRESLALYLGLADVGRFDPDALRAWADRHARGRYPFSADAQARVIAVVGDAFDGLDTPLTVDRSAVATARARLRSPPGAEIHARMLEDHSTSIPRFGVDSAFDERVSWVFASAGLPAPGVPGYFSEPGFYEHFLTHAPRAIRDYRSEDWLIGEEAEAIADGEIFSELGAAYARDYIAAWNDFLDGLVVREAATTAQALRLMEALLSSDSPLDALVRTVAEHTALPAVRGSQDGAVAPPANDAGTGGVVSAGIVDTVQHAVGQQHPTWPGDTVRRAFAPYHALHNDRTADLPGLAAIRARLGDLHAAMAAVDGDSDPSRAAFELARRWIDDARESEVHALRRVTAIQPQPLRRMLETLSDQSTAIVMDLTRQHLARRWRDTVFDECRRAIAGRYPVDRKADTAIAPDDFETFFAAGGTVGRFFGEHIEPFVDTAGSAWSERSVHGHRLGLRGDALESLRDAGTIRRAFGLDTGRLDAAGFSIEPYYLDSKALWITVETGFRTFSYRHEPPRRFRMKLSEDAVSIGVYDRAGTAHVSRLAAPWAWLRMLDRFRFEPAGVPDQHEFTVAIGGLEAAFRVSADSIVNPLEPEVLTRFHCAERLL